MKRASSTRPCRFALALLVAVGMVPIGLGGCAARKNGAEGTGASTGKSGPATLTQTSSGAPFKSDAPSVPSEVVERVDDLEKLAVQAIALNDFIYKIEGQGAVFLVNTDAGSVLVDTGHDNEQSIAQKALVEELATGPIVKIVVTHAHPDHAGGLVHWQSEIAAETEFVAHQRYGYMSRLQSEPLPYLKRRFHVLYPTLVDLSPEADRVYWQMTPDREVYPGSDYAFELGGVRFEVIALENTGEGEDGLLLWLPDHDVLFVGDLFGTLYPMFPNLYTVRGEKVRDPLDYIDALDRVLDLDPELLVPTHFNVIRGREIIRSSVTRMRDAVQFVWDATIAGMNDGQTLWQVMETVELPESLRLSQGHGKVSWTVRAMWEMVVGWYDYETVANLYAVPPSAVYADLVELAGGPEALAARAKAYLDEGRPLEALRLLDVAGAAEGRESVDVLRTRIEVVERLLARARETTRNYSEIGLLEADLRATREKLAASQD